mmetsp:Transcript_26584/g.77642  ORF Transcript_26584/g.77642 Transcript_26584/m.77642 type:complete len:104 (-) Transcript_26584:230-541(-)
MSPAPSPVTGFAPGDAGEWDERRAVWRHDGIEGRRKELKEDDRLREYILLRIVTLPASAAGPAKGAAPPPAVSPSSPTGGAGPAAGTDGERRSTSNGSSFLEM